MEFIDSPERCQLACTKDPACRYFVYDYDLDDCELLNSPLRKCDILRGPPEPSYDTCFNSSTTSTNKPTDKTTTTVVSTTELTTEQPQRLVPMMVGGYGITGLMADAEIVDPYQSDSNCLKPQDFPDSRYGMIAELFNETPLVCSGYGVGGDQEDCFTFDGEKWVPASTNLTIARRYATSIVLNDNTMWVSGGDKETSKSSSETLHIGGKFHQTSILPKAMEQHCSARINDTHFFMAGNYYQQQIDAYIVRVDDNDIDKYHYTRLPSMHHQRYGAACMVINGTDKNDIRLLVAGGYRFDSFTTTEIYSLDTHSWQDGPTLPRGFFYGSYIQYPNGGDFVMMGGKDDSGVIFDDFMIYNRDSGKFEVMPGNLETGRWSFAATLVLVRDDC